MITVADITKLARDLSPQLANEARLRCAIGRAYYAAFHNCWTAAGKWCGTLTAEEEKDKGKHERLYIQLEGHSKNSAFDAELRYIAQNAKKLRDLRVKADYNLDADIVRADVERGYHYMGEVQTSFERLVHIAKKLDESPSKPN